MQYTNHVENSCEKFRVWQIRVARNSQRCYQFFILSLLSPWSSPSKESHHPFSLTAPAMLFLFFLFKKKGGRAYRFSFLPSSERTGSFLSRPYVYISSEPGDAPLALLFLLQQTSAAYPNRLFRFFFFFLRIYFSPYFCSGHRNWAHMRISNIEY